MTRSEKLVHGSLADVIHRAAHTLSNAGIEDAPLETELLLRHVLGINRAQLYIRLEESLAAEEAEAFQRLVERRLRHEPSAYITGQREFYGLEFYVNTHVFIPRPESELLVERALKQARCLLASRESFTSLAPILIADVGTGSGAIAISLALNLPQTKVYAIDVSAAALEVAALNCRRHEVTEQVVLLQGDMLTTLPEPVDLIVANLPYIKESELSELNSEVVDFEPFLALYGGRDGLDKIQSLLSQSKDKLRPKAHILLEIGMGQEEEAISLVTQCLPMAEIELFHDLNGINRVIEIHEL